MEQKTQSKEGKKTWLRSYLPLIIIVIVIVTAGSLWYKQYLKYITTDDAYVDTDKVNVSSKVMGRVIALHADEGNLVKEGDLLVELDSSEILSQKEQIISMRNQAIAGKNQAVAKLAFDEQNTKVIRINLDKAQDDFKRAQEQFTGGVITQEKMDNVSKALDIAKAQWNAANSQLAVSRSQIASSEAAIKTAMAQIAVVETQLQNMKIFAPANGIIAKRYLLPGDIAQPGQAVFTISKNEKIWVLVNLQETKLSGVHLGQDVLFTIDTYEDKEFKGKVFYIGNATASQFSLIPPNNASGNFTKVTQRVPLKISIDSLEDGGSLADLHILPGMSAVIKIIR